MKIRKRLICCLLCAIMVFSFSVDLDALASQAEAEIPADRNPWSADGKMIKDKNQETPGGNDWWAEAIGAYDAWAYVDAHKDELADVTVGIIDNGFDTEHEELRGKLAEPEGINGNTPADHGTHVAGIIGARNDDKGIRGIADTANMVYVDWSPETNDVNNPDYDSSNRLENGDYLSIIRQLVQQTDHIVINNSWYTYLLSKNGFTSNLFDSLFKKVESDIPEVSHPENEKKGEFERSMIYFYYWLSSTPFAQMVPELQELQEALDNAYNAFVDYAFPTNTIQKEILNIELLVELMLGENQRFMIVECSGNGLDNKGPGFDTENGGPTLWIHEEVFNLLPGEMRTELAMRGITYQSIIDHIIVVGAVENIQDKSGLYLVTDYSNFGNNVEICAPGTGIISTLTLRDDSENPKNRNNGKTYGNLSGTSMAAPMVSGAAALVWQVNPDLSAAEVKEILISCNPEGAIGVTGEDKGRLYPMLNVGMAVQKAAELKQQAEASKESSQGEAATSAQYRLVKKSEYSMDGDVLMYSTEYRYNENGQLTEEVMHTAAGAEYDNKINYEYDGSGRLTRMLEKLGGGETYITRYYYNDSGELIEEKMFAGGIEDDAMIESRHEYSYSDGKLIRDEKINWSREISDYEYDGDLLKSISVYYKNRTSGSEEFTGKTIFTYDEEGRLSEKVYEDADNYHNITNRYYYDEDGCLVKENVFDSFTVAVRIEYEYESVSGTDAKESFAQGGSPSAGNTVDLSGDEWRHAYKESLVPLRSHSDANYIRVHLLNVDADDIPEMLVELPSNAEGARLFYYDGQQLQQQNLYSYSFSYIPGSGLFREAGGHMDVYYDTVYQIKNGSVQVIGRGEFGAEDNSDVQYDAAGSPIYVYNWGGRSVDKASYYDSLNVLFDTSREVKPEYGESMSLDQVLDLLG